MASMACLVCFISTVNSRSKKRKEKKRKEKKRKEKKRKEKKRKEKKRKEKKRKEKKRKEKKPIRTGAISGYIRNLKQSILETFDIYD